MNMLRLILLSFTLSAACDYMVMPTDFSTVPAGTRANLKANFSEAENKFNPCADSVAEVRSVLSGYSTSLTITSLEHLKLRLDGDGTATARLIVESGSGDSLFRVAEDYNSRLFGHLAIDSNLTVRKVTAADSLIGPSLTLSGLTASSLVATNAGKTLASSVSSLSPTFTGLTLSGLTASRLAASDGSKGVASVSDLTSWIAGTANQITSTSDGDGTLTLSLPSAVTMPGTLSSGAFSATTGSFSSTLGVTGAATMGTVNASGDVSVSRNGNGINAVVSVTNTDNTAGNSNAILKAATGGTSGGDPFTQYTVGGAGAVWSTGPDNSDGDAYVVTAAISPGGATNAIKMTTAGAISIPGTLDVIGAVTLTSAPVFSSVTASEFLLVNGSKALTSVAGTGSGSVMRAISPTTTGTLTADAITASGITTATGGLTLGARFIDKTTTVTSGTTSITTAHSTIFADGTSGTVTLNLPAASGNAGLTYTIFDIDATTNAVTVDGNASETIGGATTVVLGGNSGLGRVIIVCDGSNWRIKELYDEGTFTLTLSGCASGGTGTARFVRNGKSVTFTFPGISCTSNSTSNVISGIPTSIRVARDIGIPGPYLIYDNGTGVDAGGTSSTVAFLTSAGNIELFVSGSTTFTAANSKGIGAVVGSIVAPYTLQ